MELEKKTNFPTEMISLPSKGILYSTDSPISNGTIELKYMTCREEDLLSSKNLIVGGTVIDKLLQSLIVTPFNYSDLLVGDKNAIMLAARILGYGKEYEIVIDCPSCREKNDMVVDLTSIEHKKVDMSSWIKGKNEFSFTLPISKIDITFKLSTQKIEKDIDAEIKAMKKISVKTGIETDITTRFKNIILSVNGEYEPKVIRNFIDNDMLARDSFELREYIKDISPDVDMDILFTCKNCGHETLMGLPIDVGFFWPSRRR